MNGRPNTTFGLMLASAALIAFAAGGWAAVAGYAIGVFTVIFGAAITVATSEDWEGER